MLEIDGLTHQFKGRSVQLDISFDLRAGEYGFLPTPRYPAAKGNWRKLPIFLAILTI